MANTKRYSLRLDRSLVPKVDAAAKRRKPPVTRTQWLREAIVAKLKGKR